MTEKTLVDSLFEPVFPSLKVWFLRYQKSVLLARSYAELGRMAEIKKRHKETSEELDRVCGKLREAAHG